MAAGALGVERICLAMGFPFFDSIQDGRLDFVIKNDTEVFYALD